MALVQTRIFRRTRTILNTSDVEGMCQDVEDEANAFMATLDPKNVLALTPFMSDASKYGGMTHYQIVVTYFIP